MATSAETFTPPRPAPEAEEVYRRWLQFLDDEFVRHCQPERRAEIVRDQLYQLYLGRPHGGKLNLTLTSELPGNVVGLALDPTNVTLEAEYYPEVDKERYARRKPLLWFWQMFDRSPVGLNHWLGIRFRCMLGRHIFDHMGTGVKIYHGVDLTYGYNLSIGDGVVIRQGALLNDRGGIKIGKPHGDWLLCAHLFAHLCAGKLRQGDTGADDNRRWRAHRQPLDCARGPKGGRRRGGWKLPRRPPITEPKTVWCPIYPQHGWATTNPNDSHVN